MLFIFHPIPHESQPENACQGQQESQRPESHDESNAGPRCERWVTRFCADRLQRSLAFDLVAKLTSEPTVRTSLTRRKRKVRTRPGSLAARSNDRSVGPRGCLERLARARNKRASLVRVGGLWNFDARANDGVVLTEAFEVAAVVGRRPCDITNEANSMDPSIVARQTSEPRTLCESTNGIGDDLALSFVTASSGCGGCGSSITRSRGRGRGRGGGRCLPVG